MKALSEWHHLGEPSGLQNKTPVSKERENALRCSSRQLEAGPSGLKLDVGRHSFMVLLCSHVSCWVCQDCKALTTLYLDHFSRFVCSK